MLVKVIKLNIFGKYGIIAVYWSVIYMKKKFLFKSLTIFLVMILACFMLISCKNDDDDGGGGDNVPPSDEVVEQLTIYTVNDFHGAIKERASRVANYINRNSADKDDETLILSAGDMFQGSAISNLNYGLDMINIMNIIGFDAMALGNHEFDWGLPTILKYFDGDQTNGEADFPLICANVIENDTNQLPANVDEYTIIEQGGLRIGIIGFIAYGIESSIATAMVEDYTFLQPFDIISDCAYELRTEHDVDIVIANGHDSSSSLNQELANLTGDRQIDAIVNGHSHGTYANNLTRNSDKKTVPCIQSGSSGSNVGVINLTIDEETKTVSSASCRNQKITDVSSEDSIVKKYVDDLVAATADVFERVIGTAGKEIGRYEGARWAVNALQEYAEREYNDCDVAFINMGGIRSDAFPIAENEAVTVNKMFGIMPFDNALKITTLKGSVIKNLIIYGGSGSELVYSQNTVYVEGSQVYINQVIIDDDADYRVATIDYVFDKPEYPFLNGSDTIITGVLFRDIMIDNIENLTQNNQKWYA